jgi:hypothetical protein
MAVIVLSLCLVSVVVFIRATIERREQATFVPLMVFSMLIRMVIFVTVVRSTVFFSHGAAGGDSTAYEMWSGIIADYWRRHGIVFVTADMMPEVGQTALICNAFALINYFNGEPSPFSYTALAAMSGCLTSIEVFRSAREFGANRRGAYIAMLSVLFSPAFVFHTSDCYKDGFVAFFTVMSFTGSMRIARKFSPVQLLLLVVWLVGLWFVRFYMVFMCSIPVVVGLLGMKSRSTIRKVLSGLGAVLLVIAGFVGGVMRSSTMSRMIETYELSHDSNVVAYNAMGGSGVTFDDGGNPFGAIGPKLAYTIASPFPWQSGSIGLHLGKIDVFIFYYLIYRAYLAGKRMMVTDREALIQYIAFLVPATVAYATTMANIGLILRQRMPIVFVTAILAALSWPERRAVAPLAPKKTLAPRAVKAVA